MWQMKRRPSGRILSSFLALLLVLTTVLNPLSSIPTYATENKVSLSYDYVEDKEAFVEPDTSETELVSMYLVEFDETDTLEAGKKYTMTLTLGLDDSEEWVETRTIITSNTEDASPSNASPSNADEYEEITITEELLTRIRYTLTTYGAKFTGVKIKDVDVDYDNYEVNVEVEFTVDEETEAGEYCGTVAALVRLNGKDSQRVAQSFSFEVEEAEEVAELTDEELAEIKNVIEMIEALPDLAEILSGTDAFIIDDGTDEGFFDEEGYNAYMLKWAEEILPVYEAYMALSDEQKEKIPEELCLKLLEINDLVGEPALYAASETRTPISNIAKNDNIKIHLFNYGSHINDDEIRVLDFNNGGTNTTAGATIDASGHYSKTLEANPASYYYIDGHGVYDARTYSHRPVMAKTLGEDGYPVVLEQQRTWTVTTGTGDSATTETETETKPIYEIQTGLLKQTENTLDTNYNYGSLRYLFDKTKDTVKGTGKITYKDITENGTTYYYNRSSGYTTASGFEEFNADYGYATNYRTKHYDLNGDGGLFQFIGGYYQYDSAQNSAYYNQDTGKFELYSHLIAPGHKYNEPTNDTDGNMVWQNFFPFNKPIKNADVSTSKGNDYVKAGALVVDKDGTENDKYNGTGKEVYVLASGRTAEDHDNNTETPKVYTDKSAALADTWFGMSMEFDFFIPKDGKVDGNPLEFEFAGDDDVWVYLDGVLILDIGGCHGAQNGTINFATGEVTTPNSSKPADGELNTTLKALFEDAGRNTSTFDGNTFADYTSHNLKFFYMERGGNISYCKLKFNLPTLPENSLMVTKQVEDRGTFFKEKDMDYVFRVVKANSDGTKEVILKEKDFAILENGQDTTKIGTTASDGTFSLKENQSALFTNMITNGNYNYYVEELIPESQKNWYSKVEYQVGTSQPVEITPDTESAAYTSYGTAHLQADAANSVIITNYPKLGDLVITKEVVGVNPEDMDDYSVDVTIESDMLASDSNCTYKLDVEYNKDTQRWEASTTLVGLPAGNYTVRENVDEDVANKLAVEYDGPRAESSNGVTTAICSWTNVEVTDGDDAEASFKNIYALRSLTLSKDMSEESEAYLAESELPEGTTFTFTLDASQDIDTFLYKIATGSNAGVKVNGEAPVLEDEENQVYKAALNEKRATIELIKLEGQDVFSEIKLIQIPKGMTYTVTEQAYLEENAPVGNISSELVDVTLVGGTEKPNGAEFTWETAGDREKSVTFTNNFQWNAKVKVTKNVTNAEEAPEREFMIQIVSKDGTYVDTAAVLQHGETSGTIRVDETTKLVITETKVKEFDLNGISAVRYKLNNNGIVAEGTAPQRQRIEETANKEYILTIEPGYSYEITVTNTYSDEPFFHDDDGKMNVVGVENGKAVPKNPETSPTTVAMMIESRFLNRKEDEFEAQEDATAVV